MNIACFHLNQIGDLLFSLPALKCLRDWNPEGSIISVARPVCKQLLDRTSLPDKILVREGGITKNKLDLLMTLREERLDAAVLFSQSVEPALLALFSGAPARYGVTTPVIDRLFTHHVNCSRPPSTANNMKILPLMGCPASCTDYVGLISPKQEDTEKADELLSEYGLSAKRLIVLAPGTSSRRSIKTWTMEGWTDVIDHYVSQQDTTVAVVGTDDMSEIIEHASGPVIDLCRKTSIPTLLGILKRAELLIGVDSGVLHMAAAVGTKVVGLYGMSDPRATGPQGEGHEVISAGLDCSPCQLSECKIEKKCMTSISSDRVVAAGESILLREVAAH